jgi:hypothetical protein
MAGVVPAIHVFLAREMGIGKPGQANVGHQAILSRVVIPGRAKREPGMTT